MFTEQNSTDKHGGFMSFCDLNHPFVTHYLSTGYFWDARSASMERQSTAFCGYTSCSDRHSKEGSCALSVHSVVANFNLSGKNNGIFPFTAPSEMYERQ